MSAWRASWQLPLGWGVTLAVVSTYLVLSLASGGRFARRYGTAWLRAWGRALLRVMGVRLAVRGAEHLAGRAARVIVFNHSSMLDIFVVCALLPPGGVPVVKREVLRWPLVGQVIGFLDVVPIDRGRHAEAVAALHRVAQRLRDESLSVFIAPEGTRSRTGALGEFRLGAFHLASPGGLPVVPLVIHRADRLMPRGQWWSRRGVLQVSVLPPCLEEPLAAERLRSAARELRERVARELSAPGPWLAETRTA